MPAFEKIEAYTQTVRDQIRWKRDHGAISEEIENHIVDQRDAYMTCGAAEEEATDRAIVQMGDPVSVGLALDRTHRPKPQWAMLFLTLMMVSIGFLIQLTLFDLGMIFIIRAGLYCGVGIILMTAAYFADFTLIGKYPKITYFAILLLVFVVYIRSPLLNGKAYYGSFCTMLFPVAFTAVIYAARGKGYRGLVLCALALVPLAFMAYLVPTMTGLLFLGASALVLLSVAITKNWFKTQRLRSFLLVYIPAVCVITVLLLAILPSSDIWLRLQAIFHPEIDPNGFGYRGTVVQSMLQSAQLVGSGNLPDQLTYPSMYDLTGDLFLTYIIYKMGWLAFGVIMALLVLFIAKGFQLCLKQKSGLGLLVSLSVLITLSFQVVSFVLYNLGFVFAAPLSLPLLSHSNIALMINLGLVGLMLSVFRSGDVAKDRDKYISRTLDKFIFWKDKKLIIDFSRIRIVK